MDDIHSSRARIVLTSSPSRLIGSTLNVIPSSSPTPNSGFLAPLTIPRDALGELLNSSVVLTTSSCSFLLALLVEKEDESVLRAMGDTRNKTLGVTQARSDRCRELRGVSDIARTG